MRTMQNQVVFAMCLGILALLAGAFAHLALTDIYHGETDVTLEWRIVQVCALVILLSVITTLVVLGRVLRQIK